MKISVVIPTLNESRSIRRTLDCILAQQPAEVIVSDGQSSDNTRDLVGPDASLVTGPAGRARQMNRGASEATGDVLLFLHADTVLPDGGLALIHESLRSPCVVGGCFLLHFEPTSTLLRFYERFTRLPLKCLCFGDRGFFIRATVFRSIGGFAHIPIFEDLDVVRRASRVGRLAFIDRAVTTSARRFIAGHPVRQQVRNLMLWISYYLGVAPERIAPAYGYSSRERGEVE